MNIGEYQNPTKFETNLKEFGLYYYYLVYLQCSQALA